MNLHLHPERRIGFVLLTCLLLVPAQSVAQWVEDGVALCTAIGDQHSPTIISDGSGGAILAWRDYRSGPSYDVYAQRVDASGVGQWMTNGVAISTASVFQHGPQMVSDGSGGAIIVWYDSRNGNWDIYAQRVNSSGVVQWTTNGVALCTATGAQYDPMIISDGVGGAIVTWYDYRVTESDIYAQRVSASGVVQWTTNGVRICGATGYQSSARLVSDDNGGAIITWDDCRGVNYDIYAQRVNASGAVRWTSNGVPLCRASGSQNNPMIASDGANGAIVTWQDNRLCPNPSDVYAQRISASGVVQWTTDGVPICTAAGYQYTPTIASDGVGGAIVTWSDQRNGTDSDMYAQRVNASGSVLWTANGAPLCTAAANQYGPAVVSDGVGGAIITWLDLRSGTLDIYAQQIDADGTVGWTDNGVAVCTAIGDQAYPTLAADNAGGAIVSWEDQRSGSRDIYAQRVTDLGCVGSQDAPTAPSDLIAVMVSAFEVELSWTHTLACATSLKIYRKIGAAGDWQFLETLPANTTSWSDLGGVDGRDLYYRIKACNAAGCSDWSNTAKVKLGAQPNAPTDLVLTAVSPICVELEWVDNSHDELGFKIERKHGESGSWTEISSPDAGIQSYSDKPVTPEETYYYQVRAYNHYGNSDYSNVESVTTESQQPSFAADIHARLGMDGIGEAKVYIEHWDDQAAGFVEVGVTDGDGILSDVELVLGDRIRVVKERYLHKSRPAGKNDNGVVDNRQYEVWLDSDVMDDDGSYSSFLVEAQAGEYAISLVHPVFRYNLVVNLPYDGDPGPGDFEDTFQRVSDYIYDATDGYVCLGKVAVYQRLQNTNADVEVVQGTGSFVSNTPGIDAAAGRIRLYTKLVAHDLFDWGAQDHTTTFYCQAVAHEFMHYAFGIYDEYVNCLGPEAPWENERKKTHPDTYGLMDGWTFGYNKFLFYVSSFKSIELSSSSDYPSKEEHECCSIDPIGTTYQYCRPWYASDTPQNSCDRMCMSCWEMLVFRLGPALSGLPTTAQIIPPEQGSYPDNIRQKRQGPEGGYHEPVDFPLESGLEASLHVTRAEDSGHAAQLEWTPDAENGCARVYRTGEEGFCFMGPGGAYGPADMRGLEDGSVVRTYCNGEAILYTVGPDGLSLEEHRGSRLESDRLSGTDGALSAGGGAGACVDTKIAGSLSSPEITLQIYPNTPLLEVPGVTYFYGASSGNLPLAWDPAIGAYVGTLSIDTGDSLYVDEGGFEITLVDSAFVETVHMADFELQTVETSHSFIAKAPLHLRIAGAKDLDEQIAIVTSCNCLGAIGDSTALTPVSDAFSVHLADNDDFQFGTALNVRYDVHYSQKVDETTIALYRWNTLSKEWARLDNCVVATTGDVVSSLIGSGGVYCAFAQAASGDTLAPNRIVDLGAACAGGSAQVELEWTAPGDDSTSGSALGYMFAYSDTSFTEVDWDSLPQSLMNLEPSQASSRELTTVTLPEANHLYYLAVRSMDEVGNLSPVSNVTYAITGTDDPNALPGPPNDFRAVDAPGDSGWAIELSWDLSRDDAAGKNTVSSYKIYRSFAGTCSFALLDSLPSGTHTYIDSTDVTAGEQYAYFVAACDTVHERFSPKNTALACQNLGVPLGDFSSDGNVSVKDLALVLDSYGIDSTDVEFDPLFDINQDGSVYLGDTDVFEGQLGEGGIPVDQDGLNGGAVAYCRTTQYDSTTWLVSVWCSRATDLAGYQVSVAWDTAGAALVEATPDSQGVVPNVLITEGGYAPVFLVRQMPSGRATIANALRMPVPWTAPDGEGLLAMLEFRGSYLDGLTLSEAVLLDADLNMNYIGEVVEVKERPLPRYRHALYQNYPNPFRSSTTISYQLSRQAKVTIRIFDAMGRLVSTVVDGIQGPGYHATVWDGRDSKGRSLASAVYFYQMRADEFVKSRKIILVK